ncbi:MAG TPA: 50S ribosomal protein L21 [Sphingomonadales bacterium]
MFAVVKTGGKQYRVAVNDVIEVEKLPGEAGATIEFPEVLMVGNDQGVKVGTPLLSGVPVTGEILEQTRGEKILIFKKKRRHHYRRRGGHRQELTVVRITGIGDVKAGAPKAAKKSKAAKAEAEE